MQKLKDYEELLMENELLYNILEHVHEGIYVIDQDENILFFNNGMEKIEGLKRSDVLGKKEVDIYGFQVGHYTTVVTKPIKKSGKPMLDHIYTYRFPDGRVTSQRFDAYPFFYKGKLRAIYSIGRSMRQIEGFIASTLEMNNMDNRDKSHPNQAPYFLDDIIGKSKSIQEAIQLSRKVAAHSSPVLLFGKTGTGKELFAQGIHNASLFANGPFVPVNCAAIPETLLEATLFGTEKGAFTGAMDMPGLFEQAHNGTIFLDEVNSMPKQLQAKMLRVLQEKNVRRLGGKEDKPVTCRIISACNRDPFESDELREDFLYRISTAVVNIAPLKERKEDILILTRHFIKRNNTKFGLFVEGMSPRLRQLFLNYHWPGNVRELENAIETTMNIMDMHTIQMDIPHIPPYICSRMGIEYDSVAPEPMYLPEEEESENSNGEHVLRKKLMDYEKKLLENALRKYNGNITKAANALGMHRQNLHYRIKRFGLQDACKGFPEEEQ